MSQQSVIGILLRGVAMGAADVVPGVSGGTIAFITGIYERLLKSIKNFDLEALGLLFKGKWKSLFEKIDFKFLFPLVVGIILSILSLAVLIEHLLNNYTILVWSFFFGLILASAWLIGKQISKWRAKTIIALAIGTLVAYLITTLSPANAHTSLPYLFFCGALALCAMILPGISGSFILILLGAYKTILSAVTSLKEEFAESATLLAVFIAGGIIGLLSFSRLLSWTFANARDLTLAVLTGFMLGSLNKVWPWKETVTSFTKHEGTPKEEVVPLIQKNISPFSFSEMNGETHFLWQGIALFLFGILIVIVLERQGLKSTQEHS